MSERRTFLKQLGATLLAGSLPVAKVEAKETPQTSLPPVVNPTKGEIDPSTFRYVRFAQDPEGQWCRQYSNDQRVWVTHRGRAKAILNRGGNK